MIKLFNSQTKKTDNLKNVQYLLNSFLTTIKSPVKNDSNNKEKQQLLNNLNKAKEELDIANTNFEFVEDEDLVDYFIYKIKAAETIYQHLLKKVKEENITIATVGIDNVFNQNNILNQ